jgi:hypothetical protein
MKQRRHLAAWGSLVVVAGVAGAATTLLAAAADGPPASPTDRPKTYTGILATRPAPDIATLVKRASPAVAGEEASESFWDLLKLRNVPDPKTVPALEDVLRENLDTTRIHEFAAAEALFCTGTPAALAVLDKVIAGPDYRADLGIMYAFHWEMPPSARDTFLRRYHLKNLAKDVSLTVEPSLMKGADPSITVTLTNLTNHPIRLPAPVFDPGHLFFENADGRIFWSHEAGIREMLSRGWTTLPPDGKQSLIFTLHARRLRPNEQRDPMLPADQTLCLEVAGLQFQIGKPGKFKVYALLTAQPLPQERLRELHLPDGETVWSGRAVSEPTAVEIAEPGNGG